MNIGEIVKQPHVKEAALVSLGIVSGFGFGFFFGRKTNIQSEEILNDSSETLPETDLAAAEYISAYEDYISEQPTTLIDNVVDYRYRNTESAHPSTVADRLRLVDDQEQEEVVMTDEVEEQSNLPGEVTYTIFDDEGWDYVLESESRSEDTPHVIHVDEFYSNERGYSQLTVNFYEDDGMVFDDKGGAVPNVDRVFGELKFGHGSRDPSLVYIRNSKLQAEYEVVKNPGSFHFDMDISDERFDRPRHRSAPKRFRED